MSKKFKVNYTLHLNEKYKEPYTLQDTVVITARDKHEIEAKLKEIKKIIHSATIKINDISEINSTRTFIGRCRQTITSDDEVQFQKGRLYELIRYENGEIQGKNEQGLYVTVSDSGPWKFKDFFTIRAHSLR